VPAKISFKFTKNNKALANEIASHFSKTKLLPKLRQIKGELQSVIPRMIVDKIKEGDVWQGLAGNKVGDRILDLQAVLGIEDPGQVLSELESVLLESIKVKVKEDRSKGGRHSLLIGIVNKGDANRITGVSGGSYISDQSGETINWMEWIMFGRSDPVSKSLVYAGSGDSNISLENFISKSRTGRALMIGDGGWDIRDHISTENFIVEAFQDGTLFNEVKNIIISRLKG